MSAKLPLQNGECAIVDKEDYERCAEHIWTLSTSHSPHTKINGKSVWLSRFVLGVNQEELEVTSVNRRKLDCRKENLITVDRTKLNRMRKASNNSRSKYKGVDWQEKPQKWRARIHLKGKAIHLGLFDSEHEAGEAYNEAALKYFGNNFHLNKIGVDNRLKEKRISTSGATRVRRSSIKSAKPFRGSYKNNGKFMAKIGFEGESIYLGNFDTPEQAAKAYDKKAYELHGDKAILNFPESLGGYKYA